MLQVRKLGEGLIAFSSTKWAITEAFNQALGRLCCSWVEDELDEESSRGRTTREEAIVAALERSGSKQWTCKDSGLDPLQLGSKIAAYFDLNISIIQRARPAPSESMNILILCFIWLGCFLSGNITLWQRLHMLLTLKEAPGFLMSLWKAFLLFPLAFSGWLTKTYWTRKWNLESIFSFNFFRSFFHTFCSKECIKVG